MVRIKCTVSGLEKFNKKINTIIKKLPNAIENSVEEILKQTRATAIKLEKGQHDNGILCEIVDVANNKVKGRIYADVKAFPFFMFEHFGTGQYAEMDHIGKTKHFIESGYTEWFIPVSKVDRTLNYPIVTINETQFYLAHGFKANHFMTDAEFQMREQNIEEVEKNISKLLKEVCK